MPSRDVSVEKSMEELLAQVQREYADDGKKAAQTAAPKPHSAEVVNIKPADESPVAQASTGEDAPASTSSDGAAAALSRLAEVYKARRRGSEFPMGGTARTLEDVIREMLHPMLQGWIDAKLPGIVERLISAELSRVIGATIAA
jgi:cell pole-organizing protein PopZ